MMDSEKSKQEPSAPETPKSASPPAVEQEPELTSNDLELPGEKSEDKKPEFKPAKNRTPLARAALIGLAVLVFLGGISFGLYALFIKNNTDNAGQTSSSESQPAIEDATVSVVEEPLTETYTSNGLRLELKYPQSWKVTEEDRGILIESASFTYASKDDGQIDGTFKLYIRKGARSQDGKYLGDGYALAPSQKLTYAEPVSGQRDSTFLTNFGLKTTDNFAYFIVQGNYELKKGDTLGPNFAKEADAYLIAGGYSKEGLEDDLETVLMPVTGYDETAQYKTAVAIVQSLKLK